MAQPSIGYLQKKKKKKKVVIIVKNTWMKNLGAQ